jgi:AraC family transcriptional regulator, regulatory protein of adaptative response / methylated-DNA-[protein]-cysteine methyltransferase
MPKHSTFQREITVSVKETMSIGNSTNSDASNHTNNDALWNAVVAKDRRFDGAFWFAVKTTGIYCRPSCTSRQPKRENVLFIESPEAAQKQGFRACKRCQPDQLPFAATTNSLVQKICAFIAHSITEDPDESVSLAVIGQKFGLSGDHAQRTFTSVLGISPKEFALAFRLGRFKSLVKSGSSVTEAMYEAGYSSSSRLYEQSLDQLGMTPAAYKRGGAGMEIFYVVAPCTLGCILLAATEKGICAVRLGDTAEALEHELRSEFAAATIMNASETDERLSDWLRALTLHLEGEQPSLSSLALSLDVRATAFQLRVWGELRRIPYGETRSYSEVAAAIGKPSAVRAVASACAANPVALVTPCHRVLRGTGELSGYRWGVERKRKILDAEKSNRNK